MRHHKKAKRRRDTPSGKEADRRYWSCGRKRPFPTAAEALACNPRQQVYKCPYCGLFHLCTKKRRKRK